MTPFRAETLLHLPVLVRGIGVGMVVDVLIDTAGGRMIGFEVLCRDQARRFLPLGATEIGGDAVTVDSPLTLLAEDQLDFYRRRATTLGTLRGTAVQMRGRNVGVVADVLVTREGEISDLIVANGPRRSRLRWHEALRFTATAA